MEPKHIPHQLVSLSVIRGHGRVLTGVSLAVTERVSSQQPVSITFFPLVQKPLKCRRQLGHAGQTKGNRFCFQLMGQSRSSVLGVTFCRAAHRRVSSSASIAAGQVCTSL